jgi:hypothetical protein
MLTISPQYVTDAEGKKFVVIPADVFHIIVEELGESLEIRVLEETKDEQDIAFKPV